MEKRCDTKEKEKKSKRVETAIRTYPVATNVRWKLELST